MRGVRIHGDDYIFIPQKYAGNHRNVYNLNPNMYKENGSTASAKSFICTQSMKKCFDINNMK